MGRPGGALWLLGYELKLGFRNWLSAKRGRISRIVLWSVLGLILISAGAAIAWPLAQVAPVPPMTPHAIVIAGAIMALIGTLMMSQAIMAVVEVMYVRNDLDLLLASPLSPWTVLIVRTSAVALSTALFYLIVTGILAFWLAVFGAPAWLSALPAVIALAFAGTGLALLLVTVLFRVIGPRQTRVVAQILGALIGAGFFLGVQSFNLAGRRREAMMMALENLLQRNIDTSGPLWLPARALLGDGGSLALWFVLCAGLFAVAAWLFSRGFVHDAAAAAGAGRGRKRAHADVRPMRGGLMGSVVRKEMRLLRRDPLLISQIGMQIVYLLPLAFLLWRGAGHGEASASLHPLITGSLTALTGFLTSGLIWITASAEDAPELIASAPVAKTDVDRNKLIAALLPVAALLVVPLIAIAIDSPLHALWIAAGCTAAALSSGYIGLWYQKPGNRREFRRRRSGSIVAGLGQTFTALFWGGAAALAVSGWAFLAPIPGIFALGLVFALEQSKPQAA
jgi:ABC-2 type transport system permease protein